MGIGRLIKYLMTKCTEATDLIVRAQTESLQCDAIHLDFNSFIHMAYQACVFGINDVILDMIASDDPFLWDQAPGGAIVPRTEFSERVHSIGLEKIVHIFPSRGTDSIDDCKRFYFTNIVQQFNADMARIVFDNITPRITDTLSFLVKSGVQEIFVSFDGVPNKSKIMLQVDSKRKVAVLRALQEQLWEKMKLRLTNMKDEDRALACRAMYETYRITDTKNIIMPGTEFMRDIAKHVTAWSGFRDISRVVVSDTRQPGEGEFKIAQRICTDSDASKRHVICTPDADVTLLSMILQNEHNRRVNVLHYSHEESCYYHIDASRVIHMIEKMFGVFEDTTPHRKRVIDDVIFLVSFMGNDILPRISSLQVENLPLLLSTYKHFIGVGRTSYLLTQSQTKQWNVDFVNMSRFLGRCHQWERQAIQFNYMKRKFGPQFENLYTRLLNQTSADGGKFDEFVVAYNNNKWKQDNSDIRPLSGARFNRNIETNHFLKRSFVQKRQKWVVPLRSASDEKLRFRVPCTPILSRQFSDTLGINLSKEIARSDSGFFYQHFQASTFDPPARLPTPPAPDNAAVPLSQEDPAFVVAAAASTTPPRKSKIAFAPPPNHASPFRNSRRKNKPVIQTSPETRESIKLAMFLQEEDKEAYAMDQILEPYSDQVERYDLVRIEQQGKRLMKTRAWDRYIQDIVDDALTWGPGGNMDQWLRDYLVGLTMLIRYYWDPVKSSETVSTWWYEWPNAPLIGHLLNYLSDRYKCANLGQDINRILHDNEESLTRFFSPEAHLLYTIPVTSLSLHCRVFPRQWVSDMNLRAFAQNNDRTVNSIAALLLQRDPAFWNIYRVTSPTIPVMQDAQPIHPDTVRTWLTTPMGSPSALWKTDQAFIQSFNTYIENSKNINCSSHRSVADSTTHNSTAL